MERLCEEFPTAKMYSFVPGRSPWNWDMSTSKYDGKGIWMDTDVQSAIDEVSRFQGEVPPVDSEWYDRYDHDGWPVVLHSTGRIVRKEIPEATFSVVQGSIGPIWFHATCEVEWLG